MRDEARTIEGLDAIKQWTAETRKKYQHTVEPLAFAKQDGKTIVTNRLTGNFPGSPIEIQFLFELDGNKIASLGDPLMSDGLESHSRNPAPSRSLRE